MKSTEPKGRDKFPLRGQKKTKLPPAVVKKCPKCGGLPWADCVSGVDKIKLRANKLNNGEKKKWRTFFLANAVTRGLEGFSSMKWRRNNLLP